MQEMQVWFLGWGDSLEGRHGNPLQYSCLDNPMDRVAWRATVHRVTKNLTWLKWLSTHSIKRLCDGDSSSVQAWIILLFPSFLITCFRPLVSKYLVFLRTSQRRSCCDFQKILLYSIIISYRVLNNLRNRKRMITWEPKYHLCDIEQIMNRLG